MPVGISSPARNLFLLGSSGQTLVTNFFKAVDKSVSTDEVFVPQNIKYRYADDSYILAGYQQDGNSRRTGWVENRTYNPDTTGTTEVWRKKIQSTAAADEVTLFDLCVDDNDNLFAVGVVDESPWMIKYSSDGVLQWTASSFQGNAQYRSVATDNTNLYVCGMNYVANSTGGSDIAFVEKFNQYGYPLWGKHMMFEGEDISLTHVAVTPDNDVVALGGIDADYGFMVKLDGNTGDVLWDKTLKSPKYVSFFGAIQKENVRPQSIFIDGKGQIYVTANILYSDSINFGFKGLLMKFDPEGNLIWQRTADPTLASQDIEFRDVIAETETEQVIVLGHYEPQSGTNGLLLSKYTKDGSILWRREIQTTAGNVNSWGHSLDADSSFYYLTYIDKVPNGFTGVPDRYTFGKVSTSGNGLGDFQYNDGAGTIDYTIENDLDHKIGVVQDNSVNTNVSNLISQPFSADTIIFDDYATNIAGKKRKLGHDQGEDVSGWLYSGTPALQPVHFGKLDVSSDTGIVNGVVKDRSGRGNDGVVTDVTINSNGYWEFVSGGGNFAVKSLIDFPISDNFVSTISNGGTGGFTLEFWFNGDGTGAAAEFICAMGRMGTGNGDSNSSIRIERNNAGSGTIEFGVNNGVSFGSNELVSNNFPNGTWHHCVCTYDAGTGTRIIYKNGLFDVQDTTFSGTPNYPHTDMTFRIGARADDAAYGFDGEMGEFRIYPYALRASQVFQNYNATKFNYTGVRPYTGAPISGGVVGPLSPMLAHFDFNNKACVQKSSSILPSTYQFKVQDAVPNGAVKGDAECVATGYGKVVVGSRADDNGVYTRGGRAFVYNVDGTGQVILTPSGPVGNDMFFGNSVDICNCNGKIAVASASSLHIFDVDGTGEILIDSSTTLPISPPGGSTFGNSVAIDGDKVWVSDHNVPQGTEGNGTVYCFDVNTGAFLYQLRPKKSTGFSRFGVRIKARDGLLIIGADTVSHPVTGRLNTGRMYLYRQDGTNERIIEPEELTTSADFGISGYAIGYGMILVGAMRQQRVEGAFTVGSGEVFAFDYKGNKKFSVRPSDDPTDENLNGMGFGGGIAISSDRIFIGAEYFQSGGGFAGKVYSFSHAGKELQSFQGSDTIAGDNFGTSAHASDGTLVIGAPTAGNTGAAYIYPVTNTPSGVIQNLTNITSTGSGATIVGATFDRGGYLIFDGVNDYLDLGSGIAITETDGWAVEGWFKFPDPSSNNTAGAWNYLFRLSPATSGGPNYEVGMFGTDNSFEIKDNGSAQQILTCPTTPNTWHYLCFGQTGTGKLFLKNSNANGSFTTAQSTSAATSGNPDPLVKLFSSQTGGNNLNAHCGEIRIYNREILTPEFTVNYGATRSKYGI